MAVLDRKDEKAELAAARAFGELYRVVARLRAPDGCPWDREQSPESLRGALLEECYELVEAIDERNPPHIAEEAGDLYLLATMITYMHEEAGVFSVEDSLRGIAEKLVRRHPHVFGEGAKAPDRAADSAAVLRQWGEIKEKIEGKRKKDSLLDSVPRSLPPLERAYKLQKKAAKVGFDWLAVGDVWAKTREELLESEEACEQAALLGDRAALEEELGDLLYSAINVSRYLQVDPALALRRSIEKFERRFHHVERRRAEIGRPLDAATPLPSDPDERARLLAELDGFWEEAKRDEATSRETHQKEEPREAQRPS